MSKVPLSALVLASSLLLVTACSEPTALEHVERAETYQATGDLDAAAIEYKNALRKNPQNKEARFGLGSIYLTSGSSEYALKELERAFDLGYPRERVLPPLLQAKLDVGRNAEVLGSLADESDLSADLLTIRGQALLLAGKVQAATESFDAAIAMDPAQGLAYLGRSRIELAAGRSEVASDLIDAGLEHDPRNQRLWLAKAAYAEESADYVSAIAALEAAAKLPGSEDLPALSLTRIKVISGDLDGARQIIDERLRRNPQHPGFNFYRGVLKLNEGDLDAADAALRIVQSRSPNYAPAMYLMGALKYRQGYYAQAVDQLTRYVKLNGGNSEARQILAAAQLRSGNAASAVDALKPIADVIEDPRGSLLLGQAYLGAGDLQRATPYLAFAAESDDVNDATTARTTMAAGLLEQGEIDAAIAELEAAVAVPGHADRLDVMLIRTQVEAGRLDAADAASTAFLEREPENPVAHDVRGYVEMARGSTDAARASFERALELNPAFIPSLAKLARIAFDEGDMTEATHRYESVLEQQSGNVTALMGLTQIALARDDKEAAIDYLSRARVGSERALQPRIVLGRLSLGMGDGNTAMEVAQEAMEIAPEDPEALVIAGQAAVLNDDADAIIRYANRLQSVVRSADREPGLVVLAGLGDLQRRAGQFDLAERNFNAAFDRGDHSLFICLGLTEVALRNGSSDVARKALEQAKLSGQVADDKLAMLEGDLFVLEGQDAKAVGEYRAAVEAGNQQAILPLAGALDRSEGRQAAVEYLNEVTKEHPDYAPALLRLGELELLSNRYENAIGAYEAIDALEPERADVLNNLAWLYLQTNNPNALDFAQRARELAPNDPNIADTLGWIMVKTGSDPQAGVQVLESAVRASSGDASVRYHLAEAYVAVDRTDDGIETLRAALELGEFPERADAEALLKRLESTGS